MAPKRAPAPSRQSASSAAAAAAASGGGVGPVSPQQGGSTPHQHFSDTERQQIRSSLLQWYDEVHRVLPWRRTPHSKKKGATAAEVEVTATVITDGNMVPLPVLPSAAASPASPGNKTAKRQPASSSAATAAAKGADASGAGPVVAPVVTAASDSLSQQEFAYHVWVSEIMLQQTQVATVIPFFTRWVTKWPKVADLAAASVEEVNAMWAGLGYYRRARYLLDGAKYVMEQLQGSFPSTAKELLQVPGVGPYTSAAVASIAFEDPAAAVDGNVIRVVSRVRALDGDPTTRALTLKHAEVAGEMLDPTRPGCFNQAVMELGATVCRPVNPDCSNCPIRPSCKGHSQWEEYLKGGGHPDIEDAPRVTRYPGKKPSKVKKEEDYAVCVLEVILLPSTSSSSGAPGGDGKSDLRLEPAALLSLDVGKKGGKTAGAAAVGAAGATTGVQGGGAKKRQRTMFEFADAAAAARLQKEAAAAATAATAAGGGGGGGKGEGDMPLSSPLMTPTPLDLKAGERWLLLVKRPEEGLLAGLWEFPAVRIPGGKEVKKKKKGKKGEDDEDEEEDNTEEEEEEEEARKGSQNGGKRKGAGGASAVLPAAAGSASSSTLAGRRVLMDGLLADLLPGLLVQGGRAGGTQPASAAAASAAAAAAPPASTPPSLPRLLSRRDHGMYLHVFSHIRRSNHVEKMTVVVVGGDGLGQLEGTPGPTQGEGQGRGQGQGLGEKGQQLQTGGKRSGKEEQGGEEEVIDLSSDDVEEAVEEKDVRPAKKGKKQAKVPLMVQKKGATAGGKGSGTRGEVASGAELRWVRVADMAGAGLPTLTQKIFKQVST